MVLKTQKKRRQKGGRRPNRPTTGAEQPTVREQKDTVDLNHKTYIGTVGRCNKTQTMLELDTQTGGYAVRIVDESTVVFYHDTLDIDRLWSYVKRSDLGYVHKCDPEPWSTMTGRSWCADGAAGRKSALSKARPADSSPRDFEDSLVVLGRALKNDVQVEFVQRVRGFRNTVYGAYYAGDEVGFLISGPATVSTAPVGGPSNVTVLRNMSGRACCIVLGDAITNRFNDVPMERVYNDFAHYEGVLDTRPYAK